MGTRLTGRFTFVLNFFPHRRRPPPQNAENNTFAKVKLKRVLLGKLKTSVEGNKIWRKSILANDQKFNFDMKILANLDNFLRDSPNSAKKVSH